MTRKQKYRIGHLGVWTLLVLNDSESGLPGADVWEELEERSGRRIHSGSIYTTLRRMRERGFIDETDTLKKGPSKTYRITPTGMDVLREHSFSIKPAFSPVPSLV